MKGVLLKGAPAAPTCHLQFRRLRPVSIVYQCCEHFWPLFILLRSFSGTTGTNVSGAMSVYASLTKGALAVTCSV